MARCQRRVPFANLTKHQCRDEAAFLVAPEQPWSNGPVEGHINRLKLINRSTYGRAKFDQFRIRVLHAGGDRLPNGTRDLRQPSPNLRKDPFHSALDSLSIFTPGRKNGTKATSLLRIERWLLVAKNENLQ